MTPANAAMIAPTMAPVEIEVLEAELEVPTVPVPDGPVMVCSSEVLMNCVAVTVWLELGGRKFAADDVLEFPPDIEEMAVEAPSEAREDERPVDDARVFTSCGAVV